MEDMDKTDSKDRQVLEDVFHKVVIILENIDNYVVCVLLLCYFLLAMYLLAI
jgi:hypothetical protein